MSTKIKIAIFDMAGTTMKDDRVVENCFAEAAKVSGLKVSSERILAIQGMHKRGVFELLWSEQLERSIQSLEVQERVEESFKVFRYILETWYENNGAEPTEGCIKTLQGLKSLGIKVVLTTGFYRIVTDIILDKLGWLKGLDSERVGNGNGLIDMSIASDEVENGRPQPDMIFKAMQQFNVVNGQEVICIGDTPSDLGIGVNAKCLRTIGLTNGTHSRSQLENFYSDKLLDSMSDLIPYLEEEGLVTISTEMHA